MHVAVNGETRARRRALTLSYIGDHHIAHAAGPSSVVAEQDVGWRREVELAAGVGPVCVGGSDRLDVRLQVIALQDAVAGDVDRAYGDVVIDGDDVHPPGR